MSRELITFIGPFLRSRSSAPFVPGDRLHCAVRAERPGADSIWLANYNDGAPREMPWTSRQEEIFFLKTFTPETLSEDCEWFRERFAPEIQALGGQVEWGCVKWYEIP